MKLVTPPLWTLPVAWVAEPSEAAPQAKETLARVLDGGETALVDTPAPNLLLPDDPDEGGVVPAVPREVPNETASPPSGPGVRGWSCSGGPGRC